MSPFEVIEAKGLRVTGRAVGSSKPSVVRPAGTTPGQRAIVGTLVPASASFPLPPRIAPEVVWEITLS